VNVQRPVLTPPEELSYRHVVARPTPSSRGANADKRTAKLEARVAELEAALERARAVGAALQRVGRAVGTSGTLDELLRLVVDTTTEVLRADRATLYLLHEGQLVSRIKVGDELETIEIEIGQGIAGHVAKTGKPLRIANAYKDDRFDPTWDARSGYRTRSLMAVPLRNHTGTTVGVLQVLNKKRPDGGDAKFTPYDRALLEALATHAAVSLDKTNLFRRLMSNMSQLERTKERLERSLGDLELLYELETAMGRASDLREIAASALGLTARACDAAAGALLHASDNGLALFVVNMDSPDDVREVIVQPGEGIAARSMECEELLSIDNPKDVRDPRRVRELLGIDVRSALAVPLCDESGPVGAIALYNNSGTPSRFSEEDGALLKLVSANVSTELRVFESRRRRERAERLGSIGKLLSGVMHDLRTPLTVISGYVQLMATESDQAQRDEHAEVVREQFEMIGAMQRDLLAYARGETKLLIRKVYLPNFCEALARQFRQQLASRGIHLELMVKDTGVAYFDERQMARAVQNLLRNSMEAMEPKGGTMTFTCASEGDDLTLAVADTGPGIPKAIRKKLFEPFVTSGKTLGTGLGLANVKKIAEEHGGHVEVRSSRKGTQFTIVIPRAMMPHSLRPPPHTSKP
jgi:signal transduction histidine kinase